MALRRAVIGGSGAHAVSANPAPETADTEPIDLQHPSRRHVERPLHHPPTDLTGPFRGSTAVASGLLTRGHYAVHGSSGCSPTCTHRLL